MSVVTASATTVGRAHGLPYWLDLVTRRAEVAKAFYASVLQWDYVDPGPFTLGPPPFDHLRAANHPPSGEPMVAVYGGRAVAELLESVDEIDDEDHQAGWLPSICVGDVMATMNQVEVFGGSVVETPVARVGRARAATVVDPGGAPLRLWEPAGGAVGAALAANGRNPGPARPTWLELETPDVGAVVPFYQAVFGWELTQYTADDDADPYLMFSHVGERVAGLIETPLRDLPGSWCPAFDVADVDLATDMAVERGAVALAEPGDMAVGRQSVIVDPLGAVFSLLGPIPEGPCAL